MYPSILSNFVALISLFFGLSAVIAAPTVDAEGHEGFGGETAHSLFSRSTQAAPRWVVYSDDWVTGALPPTSDVTGFNVYILSFLLPSGAADQAQNWEELTAAQRSTALSEYHAAGIYVLVSAFGSTIEPTEEGLDPVSTASTMAQWVTEYALDGIDVDYEDFDSFNNGGGDAETWLISFTQALRQSLPQGQYILTHAPVAPWFSPSLWSGGGYLAVNSAVGSLIDWYNVQFYNQGSTEYTTCSGLLTESSSTWPESALFQIAASGVELSKLVIGKPGTASDASNGYIAPATLAGCVLDAADQGWNAGVMVWEYPDANSGWIETVRASAFPVSGTPPPISPTTQSTSTSSPGSGSGICAGVAAWTTGIAYVGGDQVTYGGDLWTAKWWTENDTPGGAAGVWTNDGACGAAVATAVAAHLTSAAAAKMTAAWIPASDVHAANAISVVHAAATPAAAANVVSKSAEVLPTKVDKAVATSPLGPTVKSV